MARVIPTIEPEFATKIAHIYVRIYRKEGFAEATEYLERVIGGDDNVRSIVVPLIMEIGGSK